jgi:type I site-specific restriction-modification system R (restriction) subunit
MLAELAACNAALSVITQTISHGKELSSAAKAISDFVINKDALKKKGEQKKNSFWHKVSNKDGNDLEEFMALEQINAQEKQLRQAMQLYGRAGLYNDWVKFQAEARKSRQARAREREIALAALKENILIAVGFLALFALMGGIGYLIYTFK